MGYIQIYNQTGNKGITKSAKARLSMIHLYKHYRKSSIYKIVVQIYSCMAVYE